ncbi:hypothetical protein GCM10009527_097020 [Actinomadura nitritigenes]
MHEAGIRHSAGMSLAETIEPVRPKVTIPREDVSMPDLARIEGTEALRPPSIFTIGSARCVPLALRSGHQRRLLSAWRVG